MVDAITSRKIMESKSSGFRPNPRLVDTRSRRVHCLEEERHLIASHPHLVEIASEASSQLPILLLPPSTPTDAYCCEVRSCTGSDGGTSDRVTVVEALVGECRVNGERVEPTLRPKKMCNGSFLELGQSYRLQFTISTPDAPKRRVLPQTPGHVVPPKAPSKPPKRVQQLQGGQDPNSPVDHTGLSSTATILSDRTASGMDSTCSEYNSSSTSLDPSLRSQLKRISQEIYQRRQGYPDRKPPPPYERVGNSIGYQLLLQGHSDVTARLIDSLYPPLKSADLQNTSIGSLYQQFLDNYASVCAKGATPDCQHPGDIPSLNFVMELILHLTSLPTMQSLAGKHCALLFHLLAIFSASKQNQVAMAESRVPTRILSTMHLSFFARNDKLIRHGWIALANVVDTPVIEGRKPSLTEPSLMLAISLIERQLAEFQTGLPVVGSLLHFVARLSVTAKTCLSSSGQRGEQEGQREGPMEGPREKAAFTPDQAGNILTLLREHNILRYVMKVPENLRRDRKFNADYCSLVKALVPTGARQRQLPTMPVFQRTAVSCRSRKGRKSRKSQKYLLDVNLPLLPQALSSEDLTTSCEADGHTHTANKPTEKGHSLRRTKSDTHADFDEDEDDPDLSPSDILPGLLAMQLDGFGHDATAIDAVSPPTETTVNGVEGCTSVENEENSRGMRDEGTEKPVEKTAGEGETQGVCGRVVFADGTANSESLSHADCDGKGEEPGTTCTANQLTPPVGLDPNHPAHESHSLPISSASPPPSPPPSPKSTSSNDSLQDDVLSLLSELRQPLPGNTRARRSSPGNGYHDGDTRRICVPNVRRDSAYYRHSVKRQGNRVNQDKLSLQSCNASGCSDKGEKGGGGDGGGGGGRKGAGGRGRGGGERKGAGGRGKGGQEGRKGGGGEEGGEGGGEMSKRMAWSPVSPVHPLAQHGRLIELSQDEGTLEEIGSGHDDMTEMLSGRQALLESVSALWRRDKGLQAATNALQGCFSEGSADISLFTDILACFCEYQSPWTLAVCVVLLPVLGQLLLGQRRDSELQLLSSAVEMIVDRFSTTILSCKSPQPRKRLSASVDQEQRVVCYRELHTLWRGLGEERGKATNKALHKVRGHLEPFSAVLQNTLV